MTTLTVTMKRAPMHVPMKMMRATPTMPVPIRKKKNMFDDSSNDSGSRSEDSEYNPEVFDGSSDEDQAEDKAGTPDEDEGVVVVRRGQKKTKRTGVQWRSNAQYLAALDSVEHERLPTALATVDVKKNRASTNLLCMSQRGSVMRCAGTYVRITLHSDVCTTNYPR